MDDLSGPVSAVTLALLALVPVTPKDRGPLSEPGRAVIIKLFHSKTKRAQHNAITYAVLGSVASSGAI